jgi:AraC-like DNA-binding protein/mannose-6-phosphate isomerase-like protein (cupin superfamily)
MKGKATVSRQTRQENIPAWVSEIGNALDHFHGFNWTAGILPNNYHFFIREDAARLTTPQSVTHNIHNRYELTIALAGCGVVCIEDKFYRMSAGEMLIIKPGQFHHYVAAEEPFTWVFFGFDLNEKNGLIPNGRPVRVCIPEDHDLLSEAGKLRGQPELSEIDVFNIAHKMGVILGNMQKRQAVQPLRDYGNDSVDATNMLRVIASFIHRDLSKGIRTKDIADQLHMSESNLRRKFRESFGVSLGSYLQRSTTSRGLQLIGQTDLNLSQIASLCGFKTLHSFSQAFTKILGMSPSAYRKHLLKGGKPITTPPRKPHSPANGEGSTRRPT